MCDTGHDDPGLQPADLLRRHTEQQEIHLIPVETVAVHRTRIARKSGARQTSFLAQLGSVLISKPVCGEVHEPGGNDPAYAREQDIKRRQCVENPFDNTSAEVPKLQVEEPTSFCMHLGLVPSLRANSGVLTTEPPEKYVSEGDGVWAASTTGGTSDAVPN